ncbi:glycosyltransferase family 4 protein [Opitutales bacterium ASA1]|uniref:glycosyltransferase n=1 Tax=Congregicoccus parvus TaxID=3081749 RepID=UPI002B323CA7|nr:glycosyltransferase family 4 protein [Opitutales bacterium ASA1]
MRMVFCSNVGGGVFGEGQVCAWNALGFDARLHHAVDLADYWRKKSGLWSKFQLRWGMYARYPLALRDAARKAEPGDILVAVTNPFFGPALAARSRRANGAKVVHLVYDLYPDALMFGGGKSARHPASRFAAHTTRSAIRRCDATVYLGDRLRSYAEATYGVAPITAVIPVGTDVTVFAGSGPTARERAEVHCLYSGHMGRLHEWETLQLAFAAGVPKGIVCELAADGPGANALKKGLANVAARSPQQLKFAGTRGKAEWRDAMLDADVALVTMRPGAEKVVMPSKTYSAMAAGQAILAVCPAESDLADLVRKHDCGWVVEPGDAVGLRRACDEAVRDRGGLLGKRRRAWDAAQALYSMEATAKQWHELFRALADDRV